MFPCYSNANTFTPVSLVTLDNLRELPNNSRMARVLRSDFAKLTAGRKIAWKRKQAYPPAPYALAVLAGSNATLRQLAKRTSLSIDALCWIFMGRARPHGDTILRIAHAIGCSTDLVHRVLANERKRYLDRDKAMRGERCAFCAGRFRRGERVVTDGDERYHRGCSRDIERKTPEKCYVITIGETEGTAGGPPHENAEPGSPEG